MTSSFIAVLETTGQEAYAKGDFAAAADAFRQMTQANPTLVKGWRMLGCSLQGAGQIDEAVKAFKAAAGLDPNTADSHYNLGVALAAQGKDAEAVGSFDEALALNPQHTPTRQALVGALLRAGQAALKRGEIGRGESELERAHKLARGVPETIVPLASHYINTGQKAKVVKLAEEAAQLLPGHDVTNKLQMVIQSDPAYKAARLAQAQTKPQPSRPAPKQVPCPSCKNLVMEWARICPVCGAQIGAGPSRFAGRPTQVKRTWQEVAYKIMAGYFCLTGAVKLILGLLGGNLGGVSGLLSLGIGIGLFTENDTVQTILKWLLWFSVGTGLFGTLAMVVVGSPLVALLCLVDVAVSGFELYLLYSVASDW